MVSLCEVLKRCSLRLFVVMQRLFSLKSLLFVLDLHLEGRLRRLRADVSRPIIPDITFVEKHFLLPSPSESSTVIGSVREFSHMDYLSAKRSEPADTSRNLSGNRWEKGAQHVSPLASRLTSGPESKWPPPPPAD